MVVTTEDALSKTWDHKETPFHMIRFHHRANTLWSKRWIFLPHLRETSPHYSREDTMNWSVALLFACAMFALTMLCAKPSVAQTGKAEPICETPEVIFCENFDDRPVGPPSGLAAPGFKNPGWEWSPDFNTNGHIVNTESA